MSAEYKAALAAHLVRLAEIEAAGLAEQAVIQARIDRLHSQLDALGAAR